jgi:hypothetical protein
MKTSPSRSVEVLEDRIAPAALIGLDDNNNLLSFDSASPGTVTTKGVTGLGPGETLIGIDVRPATGLLYGLTIDSANAGRLYAIDTVTGLATLSALLIADPTDASAPYVSLSGTNFGTDFNPVPDRLRVVSDTNQNLRINVDTGFVLTDGDINPTGSTLSGAAYLNSFVGTAATTLYDIDVVGNRLLTQNPPNNGTLVEVGGLGFDVTGVGGFDILSTRASNGNVTNTGFAVLTVGGTTGLYGINLATGAAGSMGAVGAGGTTLRGLTSLFGTPAATAYTIDGSFHLVRFNTATPGVTTDLGSINGLVETVGERIVGFDFRPADGQLYAITKDDANVGRLYTINTATAEATLSVPLVADASDATNPFTSLNGSDFGVDFNPAADRLRVVSSSGQDLRINVDTGAVITDATLNGAATGAVAAAYTNSFARAASTTLYDIDSVTDTLYIQMPPNAGTLVAVGALGIDIQFVAGFDIRSNNEAYATLTVGGATGLYSINLSTGAATSIGNIVGAPGTFNGLAIAPSGTLQFNPPGLASEAESNGFSTLTVSRVGGSDGTISVIVNTVDGTAFAGEDYVATSRILTFGPGVTTQAFEVPLISDDAFEGTETFSVALSKPGGASAVDGQFNTVTVSILDAGPALVGLDNANQLLFFKASSPGTISSTTGVTGLGAGETLVGIDYRPSNGLLYGLTIGAANVGRLYVINPATGAAIFSAQLSANPADDSPGNPAYTTLAGANFGLDFNPQADRLRVVSDSGQNLRINVDNGQVITDLDINPGTSTLAASAYTNSFAGTTSTSLFGIDIADNTLVLQNPPNSGTLTVVGSLGINPSDVSGFDIVTARTSNGTITNMAYAAVTAGNVTSIFVIDLNFGLASLAGDVGDGGTALRGLTSPTVAPGVRAFTIDGTNTLVSFQTATPSATTSIGTISGLGAGEAVVGFDFRPADGLLYAVTRDGSNAGRLYTINTTSAAATLLGVLAADAADLTSPYTALSGASFGVDFNPAADRLRIISDNGQNLRVNVGTFGVTTDLDLTGTNPTVTGATAAAYTNNVSGAAATTLYDIDPATDRLFTQNPPNNGTLVAVGALGVDATAVGGFDIRANGEAFATLTVGGITSLYKINLQTGAAVSTGTVGATGSGTSLGLALAPAGTLQFAPAFNVTEGAAPGMITVDRVGGSEGVVSVVVSFGGGTATAGTDYDATTRVVTFAAGEITKTIAVPLFNDAIYEGSETFTATLGDPAGGAGINGSNATTVTIGDDEAVPTLTINDITMAEGNSGNTLFTFTVTLSNQTQADVTLDFTTVDGSALGAEDFAAASGQLVIPGGSTTGSITVMVVGDTTSEPTESFGVNLTNASANATFADATGAGTILNDDATSVTPGKVTYTDGDGDTVTLKITAGSLDASDLIFVPSGANGGVQLVHLNLSAAEFLNANVTVTAKRGSAGGDGFANIGYLNAGTGVNAHGLGNVSIKGDVGRIDSGAVKSLTIQSLGKLGTSTQEPGGNLISTIEGDLKKLLVVGDIDQATLVVTGSTGALKVNGSIIGGDDQYSGSLQVVGRIGSLNVLGSIEGGDGDSSGSIAAQTAGAIKIRGDLDGGSIYLLGTTGPAANAKAASVLKSLTISGRVQNSNILLGFDRDGIALNADVQSGPITASSWVASNLSAGIEPDVDGQFGTDNNTVIVGGGEVVSRIAKITIKGQVLGSPDSITDVFGFVAEQIGSFKTGAAKFPLTNGVDNLIAGSTGDVFVREYAVL